MIFTKTHLIPFVNRLIQDDPNDHYVRVIFAESQDYRFLSGKLFPIMQELARGVMEVAVKTKPDTENTSRVGLPFTSNSNIRANYVQLMCLASAMASGRAAKMSTEQYVDEFARQLINIIQEIHVHSRHMSTVPGADIARLVVRDPVTLPRGILQQDDFSFTLDVYVDLTDAIKTGGLDEMYRESQPGGKKKKVSLNDAVPEVLSGGSAAMRAAATQLSMDGGGADDMTGVAYPLEQDTGESLPGFEPEHVAHTQQPVVSEVPIESVSDVPSLNAKPAEESISPEGLAPITRY